MLSRIGFRHCVRREQRMKQWQKRTTLVTSHQTTKGPDFRMDKMKTEF